MEFTNHFLFSKHFCVFCVFVTQITTTCVFADADAIQQINDCGRTKLSQNGKALLTYSDSLSKIAGNLVNNSKKPWNDLDANGSRMVLYANYQCTSEDMVKDNKKAFAHALNTVVRKFSEYIGLATKDFPKCELGNIEFHSYSGSMAVYERLYFIDTGNQGKVFLGKENSSDVLVAIKTGLRSELEEEARCYNEIGQHDGLLKLLNHGVSAKKNDEYVLVLELMFTDLIDLLQLCGSKFSLKTSIQITQQLLRAAKHIHDKKHVHRDLKLENIMIPIAKNAAFSDRNFFKIGDLGLAKKSDVIDSQTSNANVVGSSFTMSTFTHDGAPARPRDDLMSIWFLFGYMVMGSQPWKSACDKIDYIRNNYKTEAGKTQNAISTLLNDIYNLKKTKGHTLVLSYPDLSEFASHIYGLQQNATPDYSLLENCLTKFLENNRITVDGKFDWNIKLNMLLLDSHVLKVGIGWTSYSNGFGFVFLFEKFYAPLTSQLEANGNIVEVSEQLNKEAETVLFGSNISYSTFELRGVDKNEIEYITLTHFNKPNEIAQMIKTNPVLKAGFAYRYDDEKSKFDVIMVLKELLDPEICLSIPVSKQMMHEATQHVYSILPRINIGGHSQLQQSTNSLICIKTLDYPSGDPLYETLKNTLSVVKPLAASNPHLLEFGYAWKQYTVGNEKKIAIVYAFRKNFNFVDIFHTEASTRGFTKFSWSGDESPYDDSGIADTPALASSSSSLSKNANAHSLNSNIQSQSSGEIFSSKVYPVKANCPDSAVQNALSLMFKDEKICNGLGHYNIRIQWKWNFEDDYSVLIIKDAYSSYAKIFYEKLVADSNKGNDKSYWKLECDEPELTQKANNWALEKNFFDYKIVPLLGELHTGIIQYVTRIPFSSDSTMDDMIKQSIIQMTHAHENLTKLNPCYISSVIFGYAITVSGAVKGVLAFKTYCFKALSLINAERISLSMNELFLHPDNHKIAEQCRSNYFANVLVTSDRENTMAPTQETVKNQTAEEALISKITKCLLNKKGLTYEMVTAEDMIKISFAVFQPKLGGKWEIIIDVYEPEISSI